MGFTARMDDFGKAAWLGLVLLSAWFYWPLALGVVLFLIATGRLQNLRDLRRQVFGRGGRSRERWSAPFRMGSGNAAFDDYREETLRRLEEEQREFQAYLERLRRARDAAEFESFMEERRARRMPEPV